MKCLQFTITVPFEKSVIVEKVKVPYHYPHLHRHKELQLTWIQKGEGTLVTGNNLHHYKAGDIFLIGANLPHVFKTSRDFISAQDSEQVEASSVYFDPEGILAPMFSLPEMRPVMAFLQQHQQGFKVPAQETKKLAAMITSLQGVNGGPDQLLQFFSLLKVLTQIKSIPSSLAAVNPLPGGLDHESVRIANIYNYILQHYEQDIALVDVANLAHMTPESFCRFFKKHTGHTFVSFLNEVRISEACKKLLSNQYQSINIIAYKCGFNSITNFNRVFKVLLGSSPRHYLEQLT